MQKVKHLVQMGANLPHLWYYKHMLKIGAVYFTLLPSVGFVLQEECSPRAYKFSQYGKLLENLASFTPPDPTRRFRVDVVSVLTSSEDEWEVLVVKDGVGLVKAGVGVTRLNDFLRWVGKNAYPVPMRRLFAHKGIQYRQVIYIFQNGLKSAEEVLEKVE